VPIKKNNPGCLCCQRVPPECVCNWLGLQTHGSFSCYTMSKWTFTVSGITNGTCSDCTDLNGDWILCWTSGLTWESNELATDTICGNARPAWTLTHNSGSSRFELTGADGTVYALAEAGFDCLDDNTLTGVTAVPDCSHPASITITPCLPDCSFCNATTAPTEVQVLFNGINEGPAFPPGPFSPPDCVCDATFDGVTFVLSRVAPCTYHYQGTISCNTATVKLLITANTNASGWQVNLFIGTGAATTCYFWSWTAGGSPFDCSGAQTLTFGGSCPGGFGSTYGSSCNWGGTVSLTPA